MSTLTPEDVIDGAINYIHEHGWCQNALQDREGRVCLMGALYEGASVKLVRGVLAATPDDDVAGRGIRFIYPDGIPNWQTAAREAELRVIRVIIDRIAGVKDEQDRTPLARFNDLVARDADDVIEVLKLARDLMA